MASEETYRRRGIRAYEVGQCNATCSEVMVIRAARWYDLATSTIVLANGTPCSLDNMMAAGSSTEYWKLVFTFRQALAENKTDNTEYALFTAICIFSERNGLGNKDQVEQIQKIYVDALMEYKRRNVYTVAPVLPNYSGQTQ